LIKNLIKIINFILLEKEKKKYVFYSEKENYYFYFKYLIDDFLRRDQKVYYITSDKKDIDLEQKNLNVIFIGSGIFRSIFFIILECKNLIITLTDLENHQIKRSKYCDKYIYMFHAFQSTHKIYTEKAFDHYDIIFCNGDYQLNEIRIREKQKNLKKKTLVKTGYLYFDYLTKNLDPFALKNNKTVLFAPTWTKKNILIKFHAENIIKNLLLNNFTVIFRPHPEHFKREREKIQHIKKTFSQNKNFIFSDEVSNIKSIEISGSIITDYSGTLSEFLFSTYRAVFFVNCEDKINNLNYKKIGSTTLEDDIINQFAIKFDPKNIGYVIDNYTNILEHFKSKRNDLKNFKKNNFYNLNCVRNSMISFFNL
tara:strand:- start:591 stop:1691 length:1101 start_codon:yes stop_codon:yes gene_type:complete